MWLQFAHWYFLCILLSLNCHQTCTCSLVLAGNLRICTSKCLAARKNWVSQCLGWWLSFSAFSWRKIGFGLNIFWERLLFAEAFTEVYFSQFSPPLLLTLQPIFITPTKNTDLSPWKHTPLGVFFMSYESLHEVAQTYVCVFNISQNLADVTCSIMLQCTVFRCNSYVWKTFPCTKCGLAAGWSFARTI